MIALPTIGGGREGPPRHPHSADQQEGDDDDLAEVDESDVP